MVVVKQHQPFFFVIIAIRVVILVTMAIRGKYAIIINEFLDDNAIARKSTRNDNRIHQKSNYHECSFCLMSKKTRAFFPEGTS